MKLVKNEILHVRHKYVIFQNGIIKKVNIIKYKGKCTKQFWFYVISCYLRNTLIRNKSAMFLYFYKYNNMH